MIEFTCKNESPLIEVTELRFSARFTSISDEQFQAMKDTAIKAGIDEEIVNKVALADQSRCGGDWEMADEKVDTATKFIEDSYESAKKWWGKHASFLQ